MMKGDELEFSHEKKQATNAISLSKSSTITHRAEQVRIKSKGSVESEGTKEGGRIIGKT